MNTNLYRKFLLSVIPRSKIASGGTHINCRCFYCSDSANMDHGHFYISIPQTSTEPSMYYCQKCHAKGVVTYKTLIEWNAYNEQIAIELIDHNKKCSAVKSNAKYFNRTIYNLSNTHTTDSENNRIKLQFMRDRLGYPFTYEELRNLKVQLSLKDCLQENRIGSLTRNANIVDQLDQNFLGFISIDNAFLNMRRLCPKGLVYKSIDIRYVNYKIFADKEDTTDRFYTIPTQIDINRPEPVKIHIAEGPFDILSIYLNVRHREPGIYTSIAGSNYIGIAKKFTDMLRLPYVELHYYPDNDKLGSNHQMDIVYQALKGLQFDMYVHRNMYPDEKDFGVTPDRIRETIRKL